MSLFVSYSWAGKTGHGFGFGSCEITGTKEPRGIEDVRAIAKKIAESDPPLEGVIILNWKAFPA